MQKNKIVAGIVIAALAVGVGVYQYVNYRAAELIGQQISAMNASYAAMAAEGLMPGVAISYHKVEANYWQNDYKIQGLTIDVAAVGTLLTVDDVQVNGFKPGALADSGSVQINGVRLAKGMQLLLPQALADFSQGAVLSTQYQYQYEAATGDLMLSQQVQFSEQLAAEYQIQLQQMQTLWQFAADLSAMNAERQQEYSQSAEYAQGLREALTQGRIANAELVVRNNGFLQALYSALASTEQTAQLAALKPQIEQYLSANVLPEPVTTALQTFLADPRYIKLAATLPQSVTFAQLQDEAFLAELQTAEQILQFLNLQLTVNP